MVDPRIRDKSRLAPLHRRRLLNLPFDRSLFEAAGTGAAIDPASTDANLGVPPDWESLDRQRQLWALYGTASGVSPAVCFPNDEERCDLSEYEALAEPDSLQTLMEKDRAERQQAADAMQEHMDQIDANMQRLAQWKAQIADRFERKKQEEQERLAKKQDLVEEVREMFGFNIDRRDPRFIEAMTAKEDKLKMEAKAQKKKKKAERQLKLQEQFTKQHEQAITVGDKTES